MESPQIIISKAESSALQDILSLLKIVDLPHDGVAEHLYGFFIARDAQARIVGCIGMERHGSLGLLRSAAVSPEFQRLGLGTRLTEAILQDAASQGLSEVLLLTTTARDFFAKKFGFVVAPRDEYDEHLMHSPEWRLPRCSSAVLMKRRLTNETAN